MLGWGGYDLPQLYPQYVSKHGGLFRYEAWRSEEDGIQRLAEGYPADVVFPCSYKLNEWHATGRITHLDTSRIDNWDEILPRLKQLDGAIRDGKPVWVPIEWGQASIVFRTDLAPEYVHNETWSILLDKKYTGRVATFDRGVDIGVVAGLLAGIPDVRDYTDAEHVAKTSSTLQKLLGQVRFVSNDPAPVERALAAGEIVAATAWNESLARLKQQDLPVKFMNPREGAVTWVCGLSIVQGTSHLDKVYDVINAMLSRASRAWAIEEFGYGAATREAFAAVDARLLAARGLSKNPEKLLQGAIFQAEIRGAAAFQELFEQAAGGF
ncbi:MAG: extracellular solute-binding protein [Gammaproteobacteria bacterium]|nr:extracellular solute-binding protein [Gammaproteobacteria bacterium]